MKVVTTDEVKELINQGANVKLIDVREEEEVAQGMIPVARHIPLGELSDRLDEFDPAQTYIFVCRSGARSGRATEFFVEKGFQAANMVGGMLAWEGEVK